MPFNIERKRLFVKTVEMVVEKYEAAKNKEEQERAMIEALLIREKFSEEDYPEISTATEQPGAIAQLSREFNFFLAAMGQHRYADAYKALKGVNNLIESFQA